MTRFTPPIRFRIMQTPFIEGSLAQPARDRATVPPAIAGSNR